MDACANLRRAASTATSIDNHGILHGGSGLTQHVRVVRDASAPLLNLSPDVVLRVGGEGGDSGVGGSRGVGRRQPGTIAGLRHGHRRAGGGSGSGLRVMLLVPRPRVRECVSESSDHPLFDIVVGVRVRISHLLVVCRCVTGQYQLSDTSSERQPFCESHTF